MVEDLYILLRFNLASYFVISSLFHFVVEELNLITKQVTVPLYFYDDERHVYENVLSYLTTSDILAMRNTLNFLDGIAQATQVLGSFLFLGKLEIQETRPDPIF